MRHDPFSTVCLQHAPLRWLEARIRTSNPDLIGASLFDEFAVALGEHLEVIDQLLLPALQPHDTLPAARQYIDAHWYLKRQLAQLKAMDRRGEPFRKRLWAVLRQLEHQMSQEATELPYLVQESLAAERAVPSAPSMPTGMPQSAFAHAR